MKKSPVLTSLLVLAVLAVGVSSPASAATRLAPTAPGALKLAASDLTGLQWALDAVDARAAWSVSRGAGVTVAVIDDGIDLLHPEFKGRTTSALVTSEDGFIRVEAKDAPTGYGHGTHVSAIIAGADDGVGISGVAPDVTLLPIVLSDIDDSKIAAAVRVAADEGAKVVNMSIGGMTDPEGKICDAVAYATMRDVLIVAAAGNGNGANARMYPAACAGVVSVSAVGPQLRPTSFTSYDTSVLVAAPGQELLSAVPATVDPTGYMPMSGTSMAAPVVAAVAALIRSAFPALSAVAASELLAASATDVLRAGRDEYSGFGVVNAARALGLVSVVSAASSFAMLSPYLLDGLTLAMAGVPACAGCSRLNWEPPQDVAVISYTLRRFARDGSVKDTSILAPAVRVDFPALAAGEYVQLIALTATGTVASFLLAEAYLEGQLGEPSNVQASYTKSGQVSVTWTNPDDASEVVSWEAVLFSGTHAMSFQGDGVPPSEVIFEKGDWSPTDDVYVVVVLSDKFSSTDAISNELAALVPSLAETWSAGRTHAYVEVRVSALNCAKLKGGCAGRAVSVRTKWGTKKTAKVRTYRVILDEEGQAIVLVKTSSRLKVLQVSHAVTGLRRGKHVAFERLELQPAPRPGSQARGTNDACVSDR